MPMRLILSATLLGLASLLAGCAADGLGGMTTSAITTPAAATPTASQAPKVDPACVTLTSQIDTLRKDGVTERVEKAAAGKAAIVKVKRESLVKMTELAKANAEFQAKCTTLSPKAAQIQAPAAAPITGSPVAGQVAAPVAKAADAAVKKGAEAVVTKATATAAAAPAAAKLAKP